MTSGTLAALRGDGARDFGEAGAFVENRLAEGLTPEDIHMLLNNAHAQGQIEVPEHLIDAQGQVRTSIVLNALLQP